MKSIEERLTALEKKVEELHRGSALAIQLIARSYWNDNSCPLERYSQIVFNYHDQLSEPIMYKYVLFPMSAIQQQEQQMKNDCIRTFCLPKDYEIIFLKAKDPLFRFILNENKLIHSYVLPIDIVPKKEELVPREEEQNCRI